MKVNKTIEVEVCDFCNENEASWATCTECGRHACYDCREEFVKFNYALNFSGSDDGEFCLECYAKLLKEPTELFKAYQRIAEIREESKRIYAAHVAEGEKLTSFIQQEFYKRKKK